MTGPDRGRKESSIGGVVDDIKRIIRYTKVTSIDDLLRNDMAILRERYIKNYLKSKKRKGTARKNILVP